MKCVGAFVLAFVIAMSAHADEDGGKTAPIPILSVDQFTEAYEPPTLENGFIGIRPGVNPLAPAPVTVAGFYRTIPNVGCETLCPAPDPLAVRMKIDGQDAILRPTKQSLDLSCGELTTELEASTETGTQAAVTVVQFASRSLPCVIAKGITVKAVSGVRIELASEVDLAEAPVEVYRGGPYYHEELWTHALGVRNDRCKLGIAVVATGDLQREKSATYFADTPANQTLRFQVLAALVPEYYSSDPDQQACMMSQRAALIGFDALRKENRELWSQLWRSRVRVIGDPDAQKALDLAFFYLHSAAHPSSQLSIAPFSLSRPEHYFGHVFWDTDAWMFLPVVLADPRAGRRIVQFRRRTLDKAEKIASLYGYQGAQYPWETSARTGAEDSRRWRRNAGHSKCLTW